MTAVSKTACDWSKPLNGTLEVLAHYDSMTLQISKEPEETGDEETDGPLPVEAAPAHEDHQPIRQFYAATYKYIKLDTDLTDESFVSDMLKRRLSGRLFLKGLKLEETWFKKLEHEVDAVIALGWDHPDQLWLPPLQQLYLNAVAALKDFLALRKDAKEAAEDTVFYRETLYPAVANAQGFFSTFRNLVGYALYEEGLDSSTRQDALTEAWKQLTSEHGWIEGAAEGVEAYIVTIGAVCPQRIHPADVDRVLRDYDSGLGYPKWSPEWVRLACDALITYGASAPLEEETFFAEEDAMAWAKEKYGALSFTLGFQLDKQMNALGATGWDFLRGDPSLRRDT